MQNKVSHSTINVRTFWISKYDLDKAYIHETKTFITLNSYITYYSSSKQCNDDTFVPNANSTKNKLNNFYFYQ